MQIQDVQVTHKYICLDYAKNSSSLILALYGNRLSFTLVAPQEDIHPIDMVTELIQPAMEFCENNIGRWTYDSEIYWKATDGSVIEEDDLPAWSVDHIESTCANMKIFFEEKDDLVRFKNDFLVLYKLAN